MSTQRTEVRTYVGQPGTIAASGWASFVIGQRYELHYEQLRDGRIAIALYHLHPALGRLPLVVSRVQFERWWTRLAY